MNVDTIIKTPLIPLHRGIFWIDTIVTIDTIETIGLSIGLSEYYENSE